MFKFFRKTCKEMADDNRPLKYVANRTILIVPVDNL